ncbi:MAG: four helix bundle protein [Acidimicrobiia bacterium]|nr:four helix bundle protein [Acidimicrobiia bacterium]MDH5293227.1 four helix bundle protein [Acidimicrobiia bacterium]
MRELVVEQRARRLAVRVYDLTEGFPPSERFGLAREIRRSAISIGSNLAEGSGRATDREFSRFVDIALGSLRELRFQCGVATDLGYIEEAASVSLESETNQLRAMLISLKRSLSQPGAT